MKYVVTQLEGFLGFLYSIYYTKTLPMAFT